MAENEENIDPRTGTSALERIEKILELAQLDFDSLKPTVQVVQFDSILQNDDISLVEVEQHLVDELKSGGNIEIRGQPTDHAVACSSNCTYDMRIAETSNNLLLMPEFILPSDMDDAAQRQATVAKICATKQWYYELKPTRPLLDRLREYLEENRYSGGENDEQSQGKKYTFKDFEDNIQASNAEIKNQLEKLSACCINGFWQRLDVEYEANCVGNMMDLAVDQGWGFDAVQPDVLVELMGHDHSTDVLHHLLKKYTTASEEQERKVEFVETQVCLCMALRVLHETALTYTVDAFLGMWQDLLPDGFTTDIKLLEGYAIVNNDNVPPTMENFSYLELPGNVPKRFEALFEKRQKWTFDEIKPYVMDLTTAKEGVDVLLLKHCRTSTKQGIKYYSTR